MGARTFEQDGLSNPFDAGPLMDEMAALRATSPQFVSPTSMTIDNLLANFPAAAAVRGKYARVSDYGGFVDRVLRCDYDQGLNLHYWNPTQAEYARTVTLTGNTTFEGLKSPTSIILGGSLPALTSWSVNLSIANRRPGEIIEIKNGLASLLGTLNIIGTGIGTVANLAIGGYMRIAVDGSGGSLAFVRLQ